MADNPVHELLDPKTDYYQVFADIEGEDLEWWKKARDFAEFARPYVNEGWEKAEYQIPSSPRLANAACSATPSRSRVSRTCPCVLPA